MVSRDDYSKKISEAYALRVAGDKETIKTLFAPQASFRLAGQECSIPGIPQGDACFHEKIGELIDAYQFHEAKQIDILIDGNRAAARWEVVISLNNGPKVTAEICDFWTIDEAGKFTSLLQFVDAALVSRFALAA